MTAIDRTNLLDKVRIAYSAAAVSSTRLTLKRPVNAHRDFLTLACDRHTDRSESEATPRFWTDS
jgi:hypothetical protein